MRYYFQLLSNAAFDPASNSLYVANIEAHNEIRFEQNLSGRSLAILVLPTTSWPIIQQHVSEVAAAAAALKPGELRELVF